MIRIGICDDNINDRNLIYDLCQKYLDRKGIRYCLVLFESGEEVLAYCDCQEKERIDLLFLDIEMPGVNGIEVKNKIIKQDKMWRLVFVSSYQEKVFESFGLKTLSFVVKPAQTQDVCKWIQVVLEELEEEVTLKIKGTDKPIRLEDIEYFEGNRNYTIAHLHPFCDNETETILISSNLGDIEKELAEYPIIRVHKSYLVNLMNVVRMDKEIELRDLPDKIPIGRTYKEIARKEYMKYGKCKVIKRI